MKKSPDDFELPELPLLKEDLTPGPRKPEPAKAKHEEEIFEADLASLPPSGVLEMMERSRTTGVVIFTNGQSTIEFGIREGAILWAKGGTGSRFGDCVRRLHDLKDADLQHALALQQRGSRRQPLGNILVGLGAAPANVIAMAHVEQAFEILGEVLAWTDGRCRVVPLSEEQMRMPRREHTELWPLLLRASQERGAPPPLPKETPSPASRRVARAVSAAVRRGV